MKAFLPFFLGLLAAAAAQAAEPAPQPNALLRVVKADGSTVIGQAVIATGSTLATINVRQADALVAANGRCAFNVKYDEVSPAALKGSTNRIYANDTLVAQNTGIDLQPGVLRTIWTQPYLSAGQNNLKVVLNAEGAKPTVGWLRVNVDGSCTAAPPAPKVEPKPTPAPTPPAVVPGSAAWNALYNAWGYSNYATTQLRGKGYAHYADLVSLNADLASVVSAKRVEQSAYEKLMARWNTIAGDPAFKAAMAAVTPAPKQK
jgi:hypothetical protein